MTESCLRTLPLAVAPTRGEALDSWLEAIAARHQTPFGDILRSCDIKPNRNAGTLFLHSNEVPGIGNVNLNWPRCDGRIWPRVVVWAEGWLAPEDAGGVFVDFGEQVGDVGRRAE